MDSAHLCRSSSPPHSLSAQSTSHADLDATSRDLEPEVSPSRQQKILTARNARFPAKKLSISGLSNKLNQFIGNNENIDETNAPTRQQENTKLHKSRSTGTIGKRSSLAILEEISNTSRDRSARRNQDISIFQDNPERPLLQSSPVVSSPFVDPETAFGSPVAFDHIHDSLNEMRFRDLSLTDNWSPAHNQPPSLRTKSRKRPAPPHFDTDDYIEHVEEKLQQARDEACSPLTRRPMKEKLRVANKEIDRLKEKLAQVQEQFETEVKRTVEHKTVAELELKRRVKDLEKSLDMKEHTIRELQYQYEERRLDGNIIASLKANIDRLEQDKTDLEAINLSMSKRNEVLTQLLAMSPTKASADFTLPSPVREKRNPRPISLILPRQPMSPGGSQTSLPHPVMFSPRALNSAEISPFKLSPDSESLILSSQLLPKPMTTPQHEIPDPLNKPQSPAIRTMSRRSTLFSEASASSSNGQGALNSTIDDVVPSRRKARRFMGGSNQLKPLLLPAITGESASVPSTSAASSPRSWPIQAPSEPDLEDTVLAAEHPALMDDQVKLPESVSARSEHHKDSDQEGPGPALATRHDDVSNEGLGASDVTLQLSEDAVALRPGLPPRALTEPAGFNDRRLVSRTDLPLAELSVEHLRQHDSAYTLQSMPMPSTPLSLISLPQPLFSPHRNDVASGVNARQHAPSRSPVVAPNDTWQVNVRKKRKNSLGTMDLHTPASKVQCQLRDYSVSELNTLPMEVPRTHTLTSSVMSAEHQMKQLRSSDNVADLLRQKNFAARPLAAITIKTIYTLISTCTGGVRDFRRDPFALARRVLANAWRMNWKMFGKVSWWVLGLFIQPNSAPKAKAAIDWDQYDAESIASRYCSSISDDEGVDSLDLERVNTCESSELVKHSRLSSNAVGERPGWGHSMYLWGKFSAALLLAIGGAVVKGPSEMLKETKRERKRTKEAERRSRRPGQPSEKARTTYETRSVPRLHDRNDEFLPAQCEQQTPDERWKTASFDFRSQLDSSSLLEQIQEKDLDSTLRPDTSSRGRLGSLFSPVPTSEELATRIETLRLSSSSSNTQPLHRQHVGS